MGSNRGTDTGSPIDERQVVLHVDDEGSMTCAFERVMRELFKELRLKLESLNDGREAIKRIRDTTKARIALVVTDGCMPDKTGFDVAQAALAERIPVVCLSNETKDGYLYKKISGLGVIIFDKNDWVRFMKAYIREFFTETRQK